VKSNKIKSSGKEMPQNTNNGFEWTNGNMVEPLKEDI